MPFYSEKEQKQALHVANFPYFKRICGTEERVWHSKFLSPHQQESWLKAMSPLTSREDSSVHISVIQYIFAPFNSPPMKKHPPIKPLFLPTPTLGCLSAHVSELYVHAYVCMYMYTCVCRHACVLARRSEENVGGPTTLTLSLFPWEKDPQWTWSYIGGQQSQHFCFYSTQS